MIRSSSEKQKTSSQKSGACYWRPPDEERSFKHDGVNPFFTIENVYFSYVDTFFLKQDILKTHSYREVLTDWENAYADSLRFMKRKSDFIGGRFAGKKAVKSYIKNNFVINEINLKDIEIRKKNSGAPEVFFKNKKLDLSITVTHSKNIAICAVAPKEIYKGLGVDIELIEDRDFSFQEVAFTQNEIDDLKCSYASCYSANITKYWTIKESVLKSLGIGLNVDLKDIEIVESTNNSAHVKIKNEVMDRYEKLGGTAIKTESYKMHQYMISISSLE